MSYNLRILCDAILPDRTIRIWDGSGRVFVDGDGNLYRAAQFSEDALQQIEAAINGEAYMLSLSLIALPQMAGDEVWEYDEATPISGSKFIVKLQTVDQYEQPEGQPEVVFTGLIDNLAVTDQGVEDEEEGDRWESIVTIEVTNRFTLRTLANGAVLSDVDQRERAKILNPSAPDDEFCSRVPRYLNATIRWPNW